MEFGSVARISWLRMSGNGWRRGSHSPTPAGRTGNPVTTIGSELTRIVWISCLTKASCGTTRVARGRWTSCAKRGLFFRTFHSRVFRSYGVVTISVKGCKLWASARHLQPMITRDFNFCRVISVSVSWTTDSSSYGGILLPTCKINFLVCQRATYLCRPP